MSLAQNYSLWLWVPACAGTTDGGDCRVNQYQCRPCERRDPYAVPLVLEMLLNVFGAKLLPVVMGPRLRGDDPRASVRILAARMRPRCARISAFPMGRAWGMPGADAPAASHAK